MRRLVRKAGRDVVAGRLVGGARHLLEADLLPGRGHAQHAGFVVNRIHAGLQQARGKPPRILDDAFGRHQQCGAALMHGARPAMPAARVEIIRIALPKPEALHRQAKRIGPDLGERGLVALAVGMRADHQIDQAVLTERALPPLHWAGHATFRESRRSPGHAACPACASFAGAHRILRRP